MTKVLKTFLFISLILATSCKNNNNFKRLENNQVVYGKVKSIKEALYTLKEKFGELQREGPPSISYYWFDEKTNLIKEQISGGSWDSTILKYDIENKLIEEDNYDQGTVLARTVYEYSEGNTKRKESYIYGNIMHISVSKFDKNTNRVELNEYEDDGSPSTKHIYEYDYKGNIIKESYQLPKEKINWIQYKYDSKSNRLADKRGDSKGFSYEFEQFDKYGNWLKQTAISDDPFYIIERQIDYYK